MFRISQLKEVLHELSRARAICESQQLTHIAKEIHESIVKVSEELNRAIQAYKPEPITKTTTRRKTTENKDEIE